MNYVRYNGGIVGVFAETLTELNLTNGQSINEDMFWKVIGFNTTLGLSKCVIGKAKDHANNLD